MAIPLIEDPILPGLAPHVSIHVDLSGFEDLIARLEIFPLALNLAERAAMDDSVLFLEAEVKDRTPVVTGRLRSSWDHSVETVTPSSLSFGVATKIQGRVKTNVGYSSIVEVGRGPVVAKHQTPSGGLGYLKFRIKGVGPWIYRHSVGPAKGVHMAEEGLNASLPTIILIFRNYIGTAARLLGR